MKFRKLVSALTLMAFLGCVMGAPVYADGFFNNNRRDNWNDRDSRDSGWFDSNRSGGTDTGMQYWNNSRGSNSFTGGGSFLKTLLPGLLGGVAGFFLGSSFGPIGKIVGAAAGFFIAKWLAGKLFGDDNDRYRYSDNNREFNWGWNSTSDWNRGNGYYPRGSETGGGNASVEALRDRYFDATRTYQDSLRSGSGQDSDAARRAFEASRTAYFDAIKANYR